LWNEERSMEWVEALVLGLVQGVTEFLPISSDGHLAITEQAFARLSGQRRSPAENLFFFVMLHLGTLAAIVVHYRAVVRTGARGLLGSNEVPPAYRRGPVIRVGLLAALATLPLIPYAFFKHYLELAFGSETVVGVGFLVTAFVLMLTAWLSGGHKGPGETTWLDALLIGIAQMFAPLPGVSRSGLTVAAALGLGLSRAWAVGFSLLIAVPAILGAAVFEFKDLDVATLTADRVTRTAAATVLAGLVGYAAIIWLVKIVRGGRLWYFSVYLAVLAVAVLATTMRPGGRPDAPSTKALDRPARRGPSGPGRGGAGSHAQWSLDRAVAPGARPALPGLGRAERSALRLSGLGVGRPLAGRP
jgi:undecaprenyl-diphosphatase